MKQNYKPPRLQATSADRIPSRPLCIRNWLGDLTGSNLLFLATALRIYLKCHPESL